MEESILQGQSVASQEFVRKERSEAKKKKKFRLCKERGLTVEQARTEYTAEYAYHKYKKTEQNSVLRGQFLERMNTAGP